MKARLPIRSVIGVLAGLTVVWTLAVAAQPNQSRQYWNVANNVASFARFAGADHPDLATGCAVLMKAALISLCRAVIALGIGLSVGFAGGILPLLVGAWHAIPIKCVALLRAIPPLALIFVWVFVSPDPDIGAIGYVAFGLSLLVAAALHATQGFISQPLLHQVRCLGGSRWHQIKDVAIPMMWMEARQTVAWSSDLLLPMCLGAELINSQAGGLGGLSYQAFLYSNFGQLMVLVIAYILLGRGLILGTRWLMRIPHISHHDSTLISHFL